MRTVSPAMRVTLATIAVAVGSGLSSAMAAAGHVRGIAPFPASARELAGRD